MEDLLVENYSYRKCTFPIYRSDVRGYYTIVSGKTVSLPESYRSYIEQILDRALDTLVEFDDETWLEWFDNAGHTDLRLKYYGRVIKVFLVENNENPLSDRTLHRLMNECEKVLEKLKRIK